MNLFNRIYKTEPFSLLLNNLVIESDTANALNKRDMENHTKAKEIIDKAIDRVYGTDEDMDAVVKEILPQLAEINPIYDEETDLQSLSDINFGALSNAESTFKRTSERNVKLIKLLDDVDTVRNMNMIINRLFNKLGGGRHLLNSIDTAISTVMTGVKSDDVSNALAPKMNEACAKSISILLKHTPHDQNTASYKQALDLNIRQRAEFAKALKMTEDEELKKTILAEIEQLDVNIKLMHSIDAKSVNELAKALHEEELRDTFSKMVATFTKMVYVAIGEDATRYADETGRIPTEIAAVISMVIASDITKALTKFIESCVGTTGPNLGLALLHSFMSSRYFNDLFIVHFTGTTLTQVKEAVENMEGNLSDNLELDVVPEVTNENDTVVSELP